MAMGYDADQLHNTNDISQNVKTQEIATGDFTFCVGERLMDVEDIIQRMRQVYGAKNDSALAAELNLAVSAASNWRNRNSPPIAICVDIAAKKGVSLDWLIFGIGEMRVDVKSDPPREHGQATTPPSQSPAAERLSQFVNWWAVNRSQDEMTWLEQQFKRAVPEYGEWLVTLSSASYPST
jgi:hypothetical protein